MLNCLSLKAADLVKQNETFVGGLCIVSSVGVIELLEIRKIMAEVEAEAVENPSTSDADSQQTEGKKE